MKLINEAEVLSKWRPIVTEATGLDLNESKNKVDWISEYCHFHEMNQSINEAATTGNTLGMGNISLPRNSASGDKGSGDRPQDTLAMSMQVAAQTIGFDLVPVVTMDSAVTILTYADAVYGGGDVEGEDNPVIVTIEGSTAADALNPDDNAGDTVEVTDEADTTTLGTFTYLGNSRIDGTPIVKVDAVNTDGNTLAEVAEGAGEDISFSLVNALENHITGFSGKEFTSNNPYSRGEAEKKEGRTMGLSLYSKTVEAETFQVDATLTREQIQDIPRDHGWDPVGQMETVLLNELSQSINKYILARLFDLGLKHREQKNESLGEFAFNEGVLATSDSSGGRIYDEKRRLFGRIMAAGNYIATRGRRGPATFAVTNSRLGSILQDVSGFKAAPVANTVSQDTGSLYPVGQISNLTVYVDPLMAWNDDRVLLGRKGDGNSPGLVFMPYLMADSIEIIAEGTMAPRISVMSRFALVEAGHHPEAHYYSIDVSGAEAFV